MTLLFTGWVVCAPDLCALQRCVDWSGQRSHSVRLGRTDLSEWDGQNGFGVQYIPYERRAQRSGVQTAVHPVKSNDLTVQMHKRRNARLDIVVKTV